MVELNGVRIWAIAIEGGQASPPRKLHCGTLAHPVASDLTFRPAPTLPARLTPPGRPDLALAWTGWFELTTGEVVGVYGAQVEAVG